MQTRRHVRLYPAFGPDLQPERIRLVETVRRLNQAAFHAAGLHLDVWPAEPRVGLPDGPDGLLDPAIADVDLIVVALYNRLRDAHPDPIDDAIDATLARWHAAPPRVLVYRCDRPANLGTARALRAKLAVVDLLGRLARLGEPTPFVEPVAFERVLYADLLATVPRHFAEADAGPVEAAEPPEPDVFIAEVMATCGAMPMQGLLGDKAAGELSIDDVYVSLYAERPAADRRGGLRARGLFGGVAAGLGPGEDGPLLAALKAIDDDIDPQAAEPSPEHAALLGDGLAAAGAPDDEARRPETLTVVWRRLLAGPRTAKAVERALRTVRIEDALRRCAHLLIEGDPGSGKTTTLKRIAVALARARRDDAADAEAMGFRAPFPLPLFVPLRHVWATLRALSPAARTRAGARTLIDFLVERYGAWVGPALKRGGVAVLLDGLDEVADTALRARTARVVAAFTRAHPRCRFVLSSRPAGLDDTIAKVLTGAGGLTHTRVAPLDRAQIGQFVTAWYRAMVRDPARAERQAKKLLARVDRNADLAGLAATPILLTAIAIVHQTGDLPERRAALYERCVQALAHRWDWHKDEFGRDLCAELRQDDKLAILMEAAWIAHAQGKQDQLIEPGALARVVRDVLTEAGEPPPGEARSAELVARLAERSGLLVAEGLAWRFRHLQFQEFLAGRRAMQRADDPAAALGPHLLDPWWWEPILLGLAFKAEHDCGQAHRQLRELTQRFVPRTPPAARVTAGGVLARALSDLRHYREKAGDLAESARRLQAPFVRLVADPNRPGALRHRRAMAEALGWFGDPRMKPAYRWVAVEPARFWVGTAPGDEIAARYDVDWEHAGRWHEPLPYGFHIQRWPVTVGEFAPFVEAGGYRDDALWDDAPGLAEWRHSPAGEPQDWDEQRSRPPNTPVAGLTWYAARAWCRWRDARGDKPPGTTIRLPTEFEWACAARRAGDQRLYAWGDDPPTPERAAYKAGEEDDPTRPTPIGLYPAGARGLWDMAGNVFEWCADPWVFGDDRVSSWLRGRDVHDARVLRGGGWFDEPVLLRVSFRSAEHPDGRFGDVGFRCVAVPAGSSPGPKGP